MKKVTGIGGVFFKCEDPKATKQWYEQNLGLQPSEHGGVMFEWKTMDEGKTAQTVWSTFPATTKYFEPSEKPFMINFRVDDLEALLGELRAAGVTIVGDMQVFDYGKFAWILDPEGNKIELWEPAD